MGVTRCIARIDLEIVVGLFSCAFNEQIADSVRITRIQIMMIIFNLCYGKIRIFVFW